MWAVTSVVILGGGPGGYEAALVAAKLGADVTMVDRDGAGGSAVLTDCVPSKTLIATAEVMTSFAEAAELGVRLGGRAPDQALHAEAEHALAVDLDAVDRRVLALARAQSAAGHTRAGLLVGTVSYVPPEQVTGGTTGPRGDVYSAGVMLFELLTGRLPFTGDTPLSIAYQHVNTDVPAPSALAPGIGAPVKMRVASPVPSGRSGA